MNNFYNVKKENVKQQNTNWSQIPDITYKIFINNWRLCI